MAFFYLKKPRQFNYKPIYYDEDKEIHNQIVANAKRDLGMETGEEYKPNIKGQFRTQGRPQYSFNFKRNIEKKSNTRIISLIALLVGLVYFFFIR